jgi:predicted permease
LTLLAVLDTVAPVFALIALGWLSTALRVLPASAGDALGEFVFRIAVPALLFRTLLTADLDHSPWPLWAAYFAAVVVTWMAGTLIARWLFKRDARLGVVAGVSAAYSNNVMIGLPLIQRAVGPEGIAAVTILLAVHLPVMMVAGTLMMERAARRDAGAPARGPLLIIREVGRSLLGNPMILAMAAGFAAHRLGIEATGIAGTLLDQLAGVAGPVALMSLGMALQRYGLSGNIGLAVVMSVLKLLLLPAVVYGAALAFGINTAWTAALVLAAAVPTGVNAYLIANRFGVGHGLASSVITLTTLAGVLSVTVWVTLLTV